jgi:hypothetical protein
MFLKSTPMDVDQIKAPNTCGKWLISWNSDIYWYLPKPIGIYLSPRVRSVGTVPFLETESGLQSQQPWVWLTGTALYLGKQANTCGKWQISWNSDIYWYLPKPIGIYLSPRVRPVGKRLVPAENGAMTSSH